MSPFRYQLNSKEFREEYRNADGKPMSTSTLYRRKEWAQHHYDEWYKVFLPGGFIDLREYQKMYTAYSIYQREQRLDPHVRLMKG